MRDPARILPTALAIAYAWMVYPEQRLGQLLTNAVGENSLFMTEDDEIVKKVEEYVKRS